MRMVRCLGPDDSNGCFGPSSAVDFCDHREHQRQHQRRLQQHTCSCSRRIRELSATHQNSPQAALPPVDIERDEQLETKQEILPFPGAGVLGLGPLSPEEETDAFSDKRPDLQPLLVQLVWFAG